MKEAKIFFPQLLENVSEEAKIIFHIFGDKVRLVGGCVRDLLTKKSPQDFDFAIALTPDETIKTLQNNQIKALPTGIKYGTITAVINQKNFEITSLRGEEENDGRHFKANFLFDFAQDAKRRDFTINALYLDSEGFVYDYFDGLKDLAKSRVVFIGDANCRITEDFLRILRFFRFSARYAKSVDKEGLLACVKQKNNLQKLSKPRIRGELIKILNLQNKTGILRILKLMKKQQFFAEIFTPKVDVVAVQRLFLLEKKIELLASNEAILATLFFDKNFASKSSYEVFFNEICATVSEKRFFNFLQKNSKLIAKISNKNFLQKHQNSNLAKAILLEFSQQIGHDFNHEFIWNFYLFLASRNEQIFAQLIQKPNLDFWQNLVAIKFPISGQDLQNKGLKGIEIGKVSKKLWHRFIEKDFSVKKSDLLNFV